MKSKVEILKNFLYMMPIRVRIFSFNVAGNELSGNGIGAMVHADQYGSDLIELRGIIDNLYREIRPKPLLVAPGGFFDKEWFAKLLKVSGSKIVDVMTLHLYNLGPG